MSEEPAILAEKLKTEGEKLMGFFRGLSDEDWATDVYTEGGLWKVRNVLSHLMTSERAFVTLFEDVRQGGPGVSEDFAIDRYNARQQEKTRDAGPQELLEQYGRLRAQMIAWVSGLNEADLSKTGRHPYLGVTTLLEMVKMVYIHNQIHYRDLRKALKR